MDKIKEQITMYKTLHRKLKIEQHEPHYTPGVNSGHPGSIDSSNTTCGTRKFVSLALGKVDFVQKSLSISKTVYIIGRAFIHLSCHDVIRPILSCSLLSWCNFEAIGQQKENVIPKIQTLTQTLRELLIS